MKRIAEPLVGTFLAAVLLLAGCYPPSTITSASGVASTPVAESLPPHLTPVPVPELAATVIATSPGEVRDSLPSTDGRWRVDLVVHPCVQTAEGKAAFDELRLVDLTNSADIIFAHQMYLCEGLGAFGLDALLWSSNTRYFYYTDAREGGPDGACSPWSPPVLRLDPLTLVTEKLESALASSQRDRIVGTQGQDIVIWDIEAGELGRLTPRTPWTNARFAWSPDGGAFAYLQSEHVCPPFGRSSVTLVSVAELAQTARLDSEHGFGSLRWEQPGAVVLTDAEGREWRLDATTGELH